MGLPIEPGVYGIDTMHSQLGFAVKHLGISVIRGTFDRFQGALTVGASLADTSVSLDAEMNSINTGNRMRDDHVFAPDWLDVETYPTMRFASTRVVESSGRYTLHGDLTIKTTTLPVALDATYNGSGVFPVDGSTHHGFAATGTISRSAFAVSFGVPGVSDDVQLALDLQFVAPRVA